MPGVGNRFIFHVYKLFTRKVEHVVKTHSEVVVLFDGCHWQLTYTEYRTHKFEPV